MSEVKSLEVSKMKHKVIDILKERLIELKEIKEREKYHGLTIRDECLIDGGIAEVEMLIEKINNTL